MEHKYHTESKESTTIVTKTKPASSSVCTKVKTSSVPPPVYTETETASKPNKSVCTKVKTTSASPSCSNKVETKTVEKPYTKVETKVETKVVEKPYTKIIEKPYTKVVEKPYTKVVEKPYTKVETKTVEKPYFQIETKTVEKPASCTKSQPMSVSTETAYATLTKTFAASTCSQVGPTDKPCSCKKCQEAQPHKQGCGCNKCQEAAKHHEEEYPEEEYPEENKNECPGYLSKGFEVRLHLHTPHLIMTCPLTLPSQFPHLIIPVDASKPNQDYHTSFNGTASGSVSTIFNFDIPASDAGKTCSLDFLFPEQHQLETSAFSMTGSGEVEFSILESACTQGTTYETKPKTHEVLGTKKMSAGNSYHIHEAPCRAGQTVAIEMKAVGDTCLNYFQDFNPCPIGLYVNVD